MASGTPKGRASDARAICCVERVTGETSHQNMLSCSNATFPIDMEPLCSCSRHAQETTWRSSMLTRVLADVDVDVAPNPWGKDGE